MIHVVLVAGGSGTRMKSAIPKQFLTIDGKTILRHSVEVFLEAFSEVHIVVVLPNANLQQGKQVLDDLSAIHSISFVTGGETRFHSVQNGLAQVSGNEVVFIHDAVRPCITPAFLVELKESCLRHGNAVPCIDVKDSLRKVSHGESVAVNRNEYKIIQTPQVFRLSEIKQAFQLSYQEHFTDEASVIESLGLKVNLCQGLEQNIKITTTDDLPIAAHYLRKRITQ